MRRWTQEEVDYLKECYPKYGALHCMEVLDKSRGSIAMKASKLKLRSPLVGKSTKLSEQEYKARLQNSDYELIGTLINTSTKTLHKHTKCGHTWLVTPNSILQRRVKHCPSCAPNSKKSISYYENKFLNYKFIEIPSGIDEKVLVRHNKCGFEWKTTIHNLEKTASCPRCAMDFADSRFLYLLYFPNLNLYKIGIAIDIKRRIYDIGEEAILLEFEEFDNGYDAYAEEQRLLGLLSNRLVNTGLLKSGNTETFR